VAFVLIQFEVVGAVAFNSMHLLYIAWNAHPTVEELLAECTGAGRHFFPFTMLLIAWLTHKNFTTNFDCREGANHILAIIRLIRAAPWSKTVTSKVRVQDAIERFGVC
jgi:hypothetical protein